MDTQLERQAAMQWLTRTGMDPAVAAHLLCFVADRLAELQAQIDCSNTRAGLIEAT
jgi:hypothetical protein